MNNQQQQQTKYTPGPWEVATTSADGLVVWDGTTKEVAIISTIHAKHLCHSNPKKWVLPEESAKANLIAAAPDMYEALSEVFTCLEELIEKNPSIAGALRGCTTVGNTRNTVRKAIAKAEGRA